MSSIARQALLTIASFTALALVLLLAVSAEAKEFKLLKVPDSTPAASKGTEIKQRQIVVETNEGSAPTAKQVADATPKAKPEAKAPTNADDADDEDGAQATDAPDDAAPQASAADDEGDDETAEAAPAAPATIPLNRARYGGYRYDHYGYGYGYGHYRYGYSQGYRPAYDGCD
jgi:hypothetical protein